MIPKKPAALAALLAALAAPATAQEPAARPLSLEEAFRVARENNPQYRKALNDVDAAEAERRTRLGAFLPSLSVGISTGASYSRTFTGLDDFGRPVTLDDPRENRSSSMVQSVSVGAITLFDGGVRLKDYRASQSGVVASEARVAGEELRLRGELERRYWRAVEAERLIALAERLRATARELFEVTQRLFGVGVRTPVDVVAAEVKVAEQEQALERARGEQRKAMLDLRQEMGLIEDGPLALTDEPGGMFDPEPLDEAALLQQAIETSPRIDRVQAAVRVAEHRLGAARAGRFPTLSVRPGFDRSTNTAGYGALFEPNPLDQRFSLNFSVSVPVFTQFNTTSRIAQARVNRQGAEEDVRAERLAVERDVRASLIDLENAYRAARNAERSLRLNRQRLEMAQEQYRLGALSVVELNDAVSGAAAAEREALRTRFAFTTALATLQERVGAPVRPE